MFNSLNEPARRVVWDSHVHACPRRLGQQRHAWAQAMGEEHWGKLTNSRRQHWLDVEEMVERMDRDGVSGVVLQGWYWQNPDSVRCENDWLADWVSRYPRRLRAFAGFHPGLRPVAGYLESVRAWGACGIGECLPSLQSPSGYRDPAWRELLDWTSTAGWPVCLHVSEVVGRPHPGQIPTPLAQLLEWIDAFPQQKWILAHWGGGLPFFALNPWVASRLSRVWFDSAASPLLYDPRVWRIVTELVGAGKVLFGSDFPLQLYPDDGRHGAAEPGWRGLFGELTGAELQPQDLDRVLSANLCDLGICTAADFCHGNQV